MVWIFRGFGRDEIRKQVMVTALIQLLTSKTSTFVEIMDNKDLTNIII